LRINKVKPSNFYLGLLALAMVSVSLIGLALFVNAPATSEANTTRSLAFQTLLPQGCPNGVYNVIFGNNNNQNIPGTSGNDLIFGRGGDDIIEGRGGNDCLFGEEGNDTLRGQDGDDMLGGGPGADSLNGGPGIDIGDGGPGQDDCAANVETQFRCP
jgi:hypothetical protein